MAKKNMEMDEPKQDTPDKDPLKIIRERFKKAQEYWDDDRKAAIDDLRFRAGEQWPKEYVTKRETEKRPCLVVDKLNQYVRQIVNDGRQNRPSIKCRPIDSGADIATAEVYQGIIKHIEDRSGADAAYDTSLDSAATCGFGYFRVTNEYASDSGFDQELAIKRVRNPLSIIIDPDSTEADASDMKFAFEFEEMDKDDFKAKYPGKMPDNFEAEDQYGDWFDAKVRIARYWWVEEEDRTLYLLEDATVVEQDEYETLEKQGMSLSSRVVDQRNIPKRTVKHCLVSGKEYLEEPEVWKGKYIPILVVWGNELDVEGKVIHTGIIRPAKDAQRLYNYSRSAFAERVALTPKAPWVAAEGQVEQYSNEWQTANTDNHSVLRYKPEAIAGHLVPPPQRQSAADIPAGFAQDMQISEHDIQASIGMYNANLGAPSNERSGKAIMARQKEGDIGTFHYHDNLNRAIRHCGRILVDLIPKIYDSNRVVRILGYDGTPDQVQLDPNQSTASQKFGVQSIYNLGVGTYDVTISTGPSYTTLRQEAAESMVQMVQAQPELMQVIGDLMVKNMDWPGAEEISDRLKIMLPPQIQQAEQAKKKGGMTPEMNAMMAGFEQAIQEKDMMLQEVSQQAEQLSKENESLKIAKLQADLRTQEFEVDAARQMLKKDFELANEKLKREEQDAVVRVQQSVAQEPQEMQQPVEQEPQMDVAQIIQAIASMQQPINITVPVQIDGKGASVKQGRAVRQPDGSYVMESVETPVPQQ